MRLGAPVSVTRLAGVPIKIASGASEYRRKRKAPKGISDAESAFEVGRTNRLFRFRGLPRLGGGFFSGVFRIHGSREETCPPEAFQKTIWSELVEAAERNNQPAKFTSFAGYEWTSMVKGGNLHRVILYKDGKDKTL